MTSLVRAGRRRRSRGSTAPASLPPAGLPGLQPSWSRLVEVTDAGGVTRTFHVLDSWASSLPADAVSGERVAGAEPIGTLLCVHGNPTWGYLWRRLLAAAPPGWRVVAPDQLGMGYSERIDGTRVLAQRVDDLGRLTDALGITGAGRTGPVVTVAHDWGGVISLGWAAEHREQLRGVVLTNTAVHQPDTSPGPLVIRLAHRPWINRVAVRWTPLFVRATTSLTRPRPPRPVRDAFAAPYRTVSGRRAVGEFVADIPFAAGHPSRPALDRIADGVASLGVPALLLWGPRDPIFGEEHLRDLQRRLPSAGLHRYERASHLLPEDAPGYVDAVRAFVAQLPGRGSGAASTPELSTGRHRRVESTPLAADPSGSDSTADRPTADRPTALAELA
ncbi:MAG TPA: alpha/beta fold hydrolase, partial [Nakamurella sp.]